MRKINCFIIGVIIYFNCFSQKDQDSMYFVKMPLRLIDIVKEVKSKETIPFSDIVVLDNRFDTSCLGFANNQDRSYTEKINFKISAAEQIRDYFTENYSFQNGNDSLGKLLVIIEKLWLKDSSNNVYARNSNQYSVRLKAKLLVQKDNCYALYSVDSTIVYDKIFAGKEAAFIQRSLDVLMANIAGKKSDEIKPHKRAFTFDEVKNYTTAQKNIPLLNDTIYPKGIFKTFEEFRENKPSIKNFDPGKKGKTDELYVTDEKGGTYAIRNFWGYSDGRKLFINQASNLFELIKIQNTFYTYGFKAIVKVNPKDIPGNTVANILIFGFAGANYNSRVYYTAKSKALQLDMETGELF
jgi:hypothetical protein